ncbi:NAD(P)H-binding protein [Sphingoaurantiacus capsulatus]|uniref:NAD(P)H-binding protein n=1 Tax=Sphingoaurantiacus capsulatus TaxID=1771310 RepID=A0ABV7XEX4_9SPHN
MTQVALIGGTGLVGREAARRLWASGEVGLVSFVRREPKARYERKISFERLLHDGISTLEMEQIDIAICCLGTTMKQAGSKGGFRRIDHDYVMAFAKAALKLGARQFILVSSVGAKRGSSTYYLSVKGEVEVAVSKLGFERVDVIRPGLLIGNRKQRRLGERMAQIIVPRLHWLMRGPLRRYRATRADTVARAIVELTGATDPGRYLYENQQLDILDQGFA